MKIFITGGAGFIGSNIVDVLVKNNIDVVVYDNFSTGKMENLAEHSKSKLLKIINGDILDYHHLKTSMLGCDTIIHLSANADVRHGLNHTDRDLKQNTLGTYNVLEAMRWSGANRIAFSSTGSVYGEPNIFPTPEDAPFPIQTSLYGASKLACEGLIQAYSHGFGIQSCIFRFVSILGKRYSHGHVIDFFRSLRGNPEKLYILGNGEQEKSYLDVEDCVDGILSAMDCSSELINIFNLGNSYSIKVIDSAKIISDELGLSPSYVTETQERGWIGDSPYILLDCEKIKNTAYWFPKYTIEASIRRTVRYLLNQERIENYERGNSWMRSDRAQEI